MRIKFKQINENCIKIIGITENPRETEKKYICITCNEELSAELMGKQCPKCQEWQYEHMALKEVPKLIEKEIGEIFTPSGSGHTNLNAIQICGFDEAFDLWGCGVYGDKETKQMKKDIQLAWHYCYDQMDERDLNTVVVEKNEKYLTEEQQKKLHLKHPKLIEETRKNRFSMNGICEKCFNHQCTCEVLIKHENPYTVKREQDLHLIKENDKRR